MKRENYISWDEYFMGVALLASMRSKDPSTQVGACIVDNESRILSTGYNGSPRGFANCCDSASCPRIERNMHQGEGYGMCRAIHAEMNALLNCSRAQTMGADLYLTGVNPDNTIHRAKPCPVCARNIIQAGINNVILRVGEGENNYIIVPASELEWYQNP